MSTTAIVGANWGDEGKGKITDYLASESDIVVRYQGGANAGHTIINHHGRFALHLLPSGVFYPNIINLIGPGVALKLSTFLYEWESLKLQGINPQIYISDRAQIVLQYHISLDEQEEARRGKKSFGSTKQGIAPFYADKALKIGIQVCSLFEDEKRLKERILESLEAKNVLFLHLYQDAGFNDLYVDSLVKTLKIQAKAIEPFICDVSKILDEAIYTNKKILLEGQLGALRDIDHGIYPYSTSSSPLAGYASVGAGIPPYEIKKIIAVTKAYSSCVGAGPFVSELFGDEGEELRKRGGDRGEYGATTGRPRRVGWFDIPATRYGCRIQGATDVALTNLDVLGYLDEIPICVGYETDISVQDFPTTSILEKYKPVLRNLKGWKCSISDIRKFEDLPIEAREYVNFIERSIRKPITIISVGPKREQTIVR